MSPLHQPVAHLSPLPHCTLQCVHVSDASTEVVLHGSFQGLFCKRDPALAPLAPEALSCGHHSQSPSKWLYRAIVHCCSVTLPQHRTVASSSGHACGPPTLADPALSRGPRLGADPLPLLPPHPSFSRLWPSGGRAAAGLRAGGCCCCTGFGRPFFGRCPVTGKAASTWGIAPHDILGPFLAPSNSRFAS